MSGGIRFFFLSLGFLVSGIGLENLPLLAIALLNLSIFLFLMIRFLFSLYRQRARLVLPRLPARLDDRTTLTDIAAGSLPSGGALYASLRVVLDWEDYRTLTLEASSGGGTVGQDRFSRGVYSLRFMVLILQEKFGLFRLEAAGEKGRGLTVYPALEREGDVPLRLPHSRRTRNFRRSPLKENSFYESRLYYPGDDPRRINWKLKARHGDLFVKDGYSSAAVGQAVLLLVNGRGDPEKVDSLVRECRRLWDHLSSQEQNVSFCFSGRKSVETISPAPGEEERQDFLAAIPPVDLAVPDSLFSGRYGAVYLFSAPESLPELPPGKGASPEGQKKVLITSSSAADGSGKDSFDPYRAGGWHVLEV